MRNLAGQAQSRADLQRLYADLQKWAQDTADPAVQLPPIPPR
jgi:hypothetical protein